MIGRIMKAPSAAMRIALGLTGLLLTLVLVSSLLGLIPDDRTARLQSRAGVAEAIAANGSAYITGRDIMRLTSSLEFLVERNEELRSAAVRRADGKVMTSVGDHEAQWQPLKDHISTDAQIQVPLWAGQQQWGTVELLYEPIVTAGWRGKLQDPLMRISLFLCGLGFLVFYLYLRKMLQQLDPSQAIPDRVRAALDTMAEGLLVLDRKGRIVLANEAFASLVGQSPNGLLGSNVMGFAWHDTAGNVLEQAAAPWSLALQNGEIQMGVMVRLRTSDEIARTFMVNCSPVLGEGNKAGGVLISFDDVTELEEKEIELRAAKNEAEQANEAKSAFLANMSHEIRTPMNSILGFTEVLKRGYGKASAIDQGQYLESIHRSGVHLLGLINDILDLSKVEAGALEVESIECAPHLIVQELVQAMEVRAGEKNIGLDFRIEGDLPETIQSDPVRLRQIFTNLVGNAIKFTDEGGVEIVLRLDRNGPQSMLVAEVRDSGIGMTEEQAAAIFDPFVQADTSINRRFGGTGLGLSISLNLAQLLGGEITVTSEPGAGSCFRVAVATGPLEGVEILPASLLLQRAGPAQTQDARHWEFTAQDVLIVDDSHENRELVTIVLEEVGLRVDSAENGEVGVNMAQDKPYAAVLMDVQMPVMDGFTATGLMRDSGMDLPIIALTGNAMKGFEQRCLDEGFTAYLPKPIDIDALLEMLAGMLDGREVARLPASVGTAASAPQKSAGQRASGEHNAETLPIFSRLGSDERFGPLVERFVTRAREQMAAFESAWSAGDYPELQKLSHWLKGSAGSVGFDALTEPAAELEEAARGADADQVEAGLAVVRMLVARLATGGAPVVDVTQGSSLPAPAGGKDVLSDEDLPPLFSRLQGDPKFHSVITRFVEGMRTRMDDIERMHAEQNYDELAFVAHWLKGSAGSVGFDVLGDLGSDLERAAHNADENEVANLVYVLRVATDRISSPGAETVQAGVANE